MRLIIEQNNGDLELQNYINNNLLNNDHEKLINYENVGDIALKSVPTKEYYLPILYIAGDMREEENVRILYEGFQHASMFMT